MCVYMRLPCGLVYVLHLGLATATPVEKRPITEEQALHLLEVSPDALALALEACLAEASARLAGIWPNLQIFLSRESSLNTSDRLVGVPQLLPLSGRLSLERAAADRAAEAEVLRVRRRLAALPGEVRLAFHNLLLSQARTGALGQARAELEELVRAMLAREQAGESSGFDRMRVERELAETEADLFESRITEARGGPRLTAFLPGTEGTELTVSGSPEVGRGIPPPAPPAQTRPKGDPGEARVSHSKLSFEVLDVPLLRTKCRCICAVGCMECFFRGRSGVERAGRSSEVRAGERPGSGARGERPPGARRDEGMEPAA